MTTIVTNQSNIKQELLYYFDLLPDKLLAEVLVFIKFLLFKRDQPATSQIESLSEPPSLDNIIGMFDSGTTDTAEKHDLYLTELFEQGRS